MAAQLQKLGRWTRTLQHTPCLQQLQTRCYKLTPIRTMEEPVRFQWPEPSFYPNNRIWCPTETSKRTLIVRGVWYSITSEEIKEAFAPCGHIERVFRPRDLATGQLRRFCYVVFDKPESVDRALEMKNPTIDDFQLQRKASQGYAVKVPKVVRKTPRPRPPFCKQIFVANINRKEPQLDDDDLFEFFEGRVGDVENAIVIKQTYTGVSRGFGFVEFKNQKAVMEAMKLVGETWENRELWIDYATSFPHHLLETPLQIKDDTDVEYSLSDDVYVGCRDAALPWPNKPFWKYGEGPIKQHANARWRPNHKLK